jgi:hypothetical protein
MTRFSEPACSPMPSKHTESACKTDHSHFLANKEQLEQAVSEYSGIAVSAHAKIKKAKKHM